MKRSNLIILSLFFFSFIFVYLMGKFLTPFIVALIISYACHTPTKKLQVKIFGSASIASGVIVTTLFSSLIIIVSFIFPIIKNAFLILIKKLPTFLQSAEIVIDRFLNSGATKLGIHEKFNFGDSLHNYIGKIISTDIPGYLSELIDTGISLVYLTLFAIMIPILTFYMLKDWDKIESFFETIFSKINKPKWITVFSKINKKLGDYVKGQLLICSILACLYSVIFSFLGISVSIECGVFTGMLSFIPFFGPFIGCLTTLSAMVSDVSQSYQYIAIILSYLIIPIVDSNFLTPKLIGSKTGIPPVWLLFSIFSMVSILGTIGIIIAVPLSIVLSTICKEIIKNFKAR